MILRFKYSTRENLPFIFGKHYIPKTLLCGQIYLNTIHLLHSLSPIYIHCARYNSCQIMKVISLGIGKSAGETNYDITPTICIYKIYLLLPQAIHQQLNLLIY